MGRLSTLFGRRRVQAPGDGRLSAGGTGLLTVRVEHVERVSARSLLFHLVPDGSHGLPSFAAGSHVDVHLGPRLVRQYSLVGGEAASDGYRICVQREEGGRGGSLRMHEGVSVGDILTISSPRNSFPVSPLTSRALLLGGGIGVTPLVAIAERLHDDGVPFELHAYARNAEEMPLIAYLASRPYAGSLSFHFSDDGESFRDPTHALPFGPHDALDLYVCGPEGFIELARARAADRGIGADRIHTELFSARDDAVRTERPFTVVSASDGRRHRIGGDETIAAVLEREGYETYRSCGQGTCGSCIVRVVSGDVDHRDRFQSDAAHAAGTEINICCSRAKGDELVIDI